VAQAPKRYSRAETWLLTSVLVLRPIGDFIRLTGAFGGLVGRYAAGWLTLLGGPDFALIAPVAIPLPDVFALLLALNTLLFARLLVPTSHTASHSAGCFQRIRAGALSGKH
jgi:hypothetical protein